MLAHEIRQKYLEFFQERGHLYLPGAPLAPVDALGNPDNSTLFTGSGMQQFKPYFAGAATPPCRRVATVQKCLRTGDIDSVGDMSHCTLFEMLGNFSFGDYFKAEVIPWTWEFLTRVVGLDPDRFCVTVFIDDEEAYRIWHDVIGLPDDRIHRQGEDKNYWPANVISAGPDGPCGPCSEVFYRVAPLEEMTTDPALSPAERYTVDDDAGRWLEVWNNVFTQFDRSSDAHGKPVLTPLPQKNNDTGAGLDRIAYVSQGKTSVFETDLFGPTLAQIAALSGKEYGGTMSPADFAFRVVAEHTRAMVFCIADGILPSNEGRGYVLRYIMRRAVRYGKMVLGFEEPFLHEVAPRVIEQMGDFYTELRERRELILSTIRTEEEQFRRTLSRGIGILDDYLNSGTVQATGLLPGSHAFTLYDTYGFPYRLTEEISAERGITVDRPGFDAALEVQRERSRAGSNIERDVFGSAALRGVLGEGMAPTVFQGYSDLETEATVTALYEGQEAREFAGPGEEVVVTLDQTPFYAESGGQVGDTGLLTAPAGDTTCALRAEVTDTRKNALGVYLHTVKVLEGQIEVGQRVRASVDGERRRATMRNHTATHLLQAALRAVLGGHVHQKGSLVTPERLRFDFTHGQPMTDAEVRQVEALVNARALDDVEVTVHVDLPIAEARARGAMALFGEKYGDRVRMVEVPGFSLELCGGTHLSRTSQVGLFKIVAESGVAAGVRRIEAVTGRAAYDYVQRREETLAQAAALLKSSPNDLVAAAERLVKQREELVKENRQLKAGGGAAQAAELKPQDVGGVPVVVSRIEGADTEAVKNLADRTAQQLHSAVVVLGTASDGKVTFVAKVTPDLVEQGLHAGNLVRDVARITGGGGGGRADFATAGGRDPGKLQEALDAVPNLVAAQRKE
jgi:alanyl-tRNA synthetase